MGYPEVGKGEQFNCHDKKEADFLINSEKKRKVGQVWYFKPEH